MGVTYFFSDAHLGFGSKQEERKKESAVLSFLSAIASDANRIVIVGDLFDAWFEYRTVIPKGHHRILAKLDELVQQGIEIHYLAGNHDFWMRDYFETEIGMRTHRDSFEPVIDGKHYFIHHGDGLTDDNPGYAFIKRVMRHPFSVWLYTWVHPDLGIPLARGSSRTSRQHTTEAHSREADGMARAAADKLSNGYDVVIFGHQHSPSITRTGNGIYINLGDWITHNTYAESRDGEITLKTWP